MRSLICHSAFLTFALLCSLIAAPTILADVCLFDSLEDVYFQGPREKLGVHQICFNGDDFPNASVEQPVFLKIYFQNQAIRLSESLVDPADPELSKPIYLPLYLSTSDSMEAVSLVAPAQTVSITRWVAGENAVWIRIQSSTSQWLSQNGALLPPSQQNTLSFVFGLSARTYSQVVEVHGGNLPYPVRDLTNPQDLSQAESLLWIADFSNHANQATTGQESLVSYGISFHSSDAQLAPGIYQDTEPLPLTYSGGFSTARANDWGCAGHFQAEREILAQPSIRKAALELHAEIRLSTLQGIRPNVLPSTTEFQPGSFLQLELDPSSEFGFRAEGSAFAYPDQPAGSIEWNAPFELDGQTLYRELKLVWTGDALPVDLLKLPIVVQLSTAEGLNPQQLQIYYRLEQINHSAWLDEPPYDLIQQARHAQPYTQLLEAGLWKPFTPESAQLLPHITKANAGFQTKLLFFSTELNSQEIQLQPYTAAGEALASKAVRVEPNQSLTLDAMSLFAQQEVASVAVLGPMGLVQVTAQFQSENANGIPAQSPAKTTQARRWILYAGKDSISWDGLAVLNRGATTTKVTIRAYDPAGSTLEYELSDLQPDAKATLVLSNHFPGFNAAYYEVEAEEPVTLLALRGDLNSIYLWENPTTALHSP